MEWMAAEVTNLEGLFEIFKVCDTLHLAINNGQYPYVVPLSYGVECVDDHIVGPVQAVAQHHRLAETCH